MNINSIPARIRAAFSLILIAGLQEGCYVLQSAQGQLALMWKREPIARVLERPSTKPALRAQLEAANAIRNFASRELGLPDNGSYRSYADLGRPYVVWNVVAAGEFSVDAEKWCYPIAGCVAYRGYFREKRARRFAAQLHRRGFDVTVGGVAAYSTLGHFNDPILNTMLGWSDIDLAAILFHELTHQLIYIPGDSAFNEALATTVEEEGVRRWLLAQGRIDDLKDYGVQQERYLDVVGLLGRTRDELRLIYESQSTPALKRERKEAAFSALGQSYARLTSGWVGAPFRTWFDGPVNNAHLASVATYFNCVPGFERELAAASGDLQAFYERVRALAKLDRARRDHILCES